MMMRLALAEDRLVKMICEMAVEDIRDRTIRLFWKQQLYLEGDPFLELDPLWTDEAMATGIAIYASDVFTPKEVELLSIALDASYTHMYAPGTRRHIKGALAAGATPEEIMETLKLCVAQGAYSCNLGIPILAKELDCRQSNNGIG